MRFTEKASPGEPLMTAEERVRISREAKPNSWVAFSGDESKVLAYGETYSDAIKAAEKLGESDPVMVKVPDNWSSRVFNHSH